MSNKELFKKKLKLKYTPAVDVPDAIKIVYIPKIKDVSLFPVATCNVRAGVIDYYFDKNMKEVIDYHIEYSRIPRKLHVNG